MRGDPDFRRLKDAWLLGQIQQARIRGETIDVVTPDGVFRHYPDGRIVKQTIELGRRRSWFGRERWHD